MSPAAGNMHACTANETGSPICICMHTHVHRTHRHPYFTLLTPPALRGLGGAAGGAGVPEQSRDWLRALPLRQPTRSHFLCPPFLFQSGREGNGCFLRVSAAAPACSVPPVLDLQCLQETEWVCAALVPLLAPLCLCQPLYLLHSL